MNSTDTQDFIETYIQWIRRNSAQTSIGEYQEITTPFVDSHNDNIQFYIKKTESGFLLSDDGYTLADLEMNGCDISSKKRREAIQEFSESLGVQIIDHCICVNAAETEIAQKQHAIIQAIIKIGDMFLTTSSRIKSIFFDDVSEYFAVNDVRNTPSVMLMGQSGLSHRFDFVIPSSRKMPERVITTLNSPSKQSVLSSIFAWNDTAKVRKTNSRGYIVLNDEKKGVSAELIAAINNYDITPISWNKRDDFLNDLVS